MKVITPKMSAAFFGQRQSVKFMERMLLKVEPFFQENKITVI